MTPGELAATLLEMVNDPDLQNRIAREAAERTDPWKWYCRLCGHEGEDASRMVRNDQADEHARACPPGGRPNTGTAEYGRELHIWSY